MKSIKDLYEKLKGESIDNSYTYLMNEVSLQNEIPRKKDDSLKILGGLKAYIIKENVSIKIWPWIVALLSIVVSVYYYFHLLDFLPLLGVQIFSLVILGIAFIGFFIDVKTYSKKQFMLSIVESVEKDIRENIRKES